MQGYASLVPGNGWITQEARLHKSSCRNCGGALWVHSSIGLSGYMTGMSLTARFPQSSATLQYTSACQPRAIYLRL